MSTSSSSSYVITISVGTDTVVVSEESPRTSIRSISLDEGTSNCGAANSKILQSGAAYHLLGFEDEDLGCSPGWWATTVATYCPSRPGNYPNSYLQNLANDGPPRSVQFGATICSEGFVTCLLRVPQAVGLY